MRNTHIQKASETRWLFNRRVFFYEVLMPYDNVPEELQDKMDSCVSQVVDEGNDKEAAIAICYVSVVEGKSLDAAKSFILDAVKIGKRNAAEDAKRIMEIRKAAQVIQELSLELEPEVGPDTEDNSDIEHDDDTEVMTGGVVKALPGGKVGGYLVTFSTADTPDITGEYFTSDTDFGEHDTTPVLYHHGMDTKLGGRVIGKGKITRDDIGMWIEAQLEMRDEYEKFIYEMAQAGKLGWSSGTAGHMIEREPAGKATYIKRWLLGLDASLTPTPAEPRNHAVSLKTLVEQSKPVEAHESVTENNCIENSNILEGATPQTENKKMDEKELQSIIEKAAAAGAEAAMKSLPAVNTPAPAEVKAKPEGFKSLGEFFLAVKSHGMGRSMDNRLGQYSEEMKAPSGMNETIPSEGGFLVPPEFAAGIWERMYTQGDVLSRCLRQPVSGNSMTFNANGESARTDGGRWGGVLGYWLAEAGAKTPSTPSFRQVELKLKKVAAVCYATDELLSDAPALTSWLARVAPLELIFQAENAVIRGTGAGTPLGLINAAATVTVAKEGAQAADTIVYQNILKMWARCYAPSRRNAVWFINQDIEPQLNALAMPVGVGGVPVYMPAGGYANSPYNTLLGRPVVPVEYCSTLGDLGDIILADMSQYQLIDKTGGVETASSIHVRFLYDETAFRFVYRVDGSPMWQSALTPAQGTNTLSPFVMLAERA